MTQRAQEEEEEEEEGRTLWIGEVQNWRDKVEGKEIRTLWIGDLQHWMDEAYIDFCFSHTREVFISKVIRNGKSSSDECYYGGFIEFKSRAIAERFLHKFNGTPTPLGTTNFSLDWASSSSFESGGEQQQQQRQEEAEDDSAAAAAADDDKLQKITMPPQGQPTDLEVNSSWEDIMKWWSIISIDDPTPDVVYATHRVYMIGAFLNKPPILHPPGVIYPPHERVEEWLDELLRHDAFIDIAKVLHSIDALCRLVRMYYRKHAGIQGKVTKLIIAMAQKNPTSQRLVIEAGGRDALFDAFMADSDLDTDILDAISLLLLNGGISAFGNDLINALTMPIVNHQRKALNLIERLVEEHKSDDIIVSELEYPKSMMLLVSSDDAEVRKAALRGLIALAHVRKVVNSGQGSEIDNMLKEFLQGWMKILIPVSPENLAPFRDEIRLLKKLWKACYNDEHFPLCEEVLLGEDTLAS